MSSNLLGSVLLDRSSFDRETRPVNLGGKARLAAARFPAAAFMSERVWSAHQKVPAIPETATAASKAVKRDTPNMLITAHRRLRTAHRCAHNYITQPASAVTLAIPQIVCAQPYTR
jgi:hypothetical protein